MTKGMVRDNVLETNIWEEYHREFNKYKIIYCIIDFIFFIWWNSEA